MSKRKLTLGSVVMWAILTVVTALSLFPFYLMTIMGTHTHVSITTRLNLLPGDNIVTNATAVFAANFGRYFLNSFYIAVVSAGLAVLFCSMAGFALAKYEFRGKTVFFTAILATMMIPFGISIVGFLIEMRMMGLSATHAPIVISTISSAYGVYLIRQFMQDGIPDEVIESARIDGASEAVIFVRLALPFTKPACLTLFLLLFMNSWNGFLVPLIFINQEPMYTVPMGVFSMGNQYNKEYGARMFALALSTLPVLVIYVLNSKNLVKGMMLGAVKG